MAAASAPPLDDQNLLRDMNKVTLTQERKRKLFKLVNDKKSDELRKELYHILTDPDLIALDKRRCIERF